MQTANGLVSSIKILIMSERPLVYFKLNDQSCLIASRSLSFLADVEDGMSLVVGGHFNRRKQFVVQKYCTIGQTRIMMDIENFEREKMMI